MKTYTAEELKKIIASHHLWLRDEEGGQRANLSYANLSYANLSYADLRYADLSYADLRYADLRYVPGNLNHLKSIFLDTYPITYTADVLQIGCERHDIAKWWDFTDAQIRKMDGAKALEWWGKYKPLIKMAVELSPATPTGFVPKEAVKTEAA